MRRLALAMLLMFVTGLSLAQDETDQIVEIKLEIFLVSQVQGTEQFRPATSARPGQIVEYRLTAVNTSEETLPAGIVEIFGPIPPNTTFVPNSAKPSSERLLTEYSADGGQTFSEEPVLIGEEPNREVAEPTSYDTIRWTLLVPMEPDQEEAFFYRVQVD